MPDGMVRFDVSGQKARDDFSTSMQWATRPDDQRYVSMDDLIAELRFRTDHSENLVLPIGEIEPVVDGGGIRFGARGMLMDPTNFSFGQYCARLGLPGGLITKHLSDDPALAGTVLKHCISRSGELDKEIGLFHTQRRDGSREMRAVNGKSYGRIFDLEIALAVHAAIEDSGATWSVPTAFRTADGRGLWGQGDLQCADPTKQSTTLYASDRDVYLFLVDERNPIEAGKLPNGDPDLYWRGFRVWNGECGDTTAGVDTFLYRGVCENRSIRGQMEFQSVKIIHRPNAVSLFRSELIPALRSYVSGGTTGIATGIEAIKAAKVREPVRFLDRHGFTAAEAQEINKRSLEEEGRPVETVWGAVQAITAWARQFANQDRRSEVENRTQKMVDLVLA